jgi:predicted nucleic acid-binding protein
MGRQIIALDTAIFAYVFNNHPLFGKEALSIIQKIEFGEKDGVFSGIGMIELLTGAKKSKRFSMALYYKEKILTYPNLTVLGLNDGIIEIASTLRAKYGLRTPDAVHLATAIDSQAEVFYTNDRKLKRVKEIKIETL